MSIEEGLAIRAPSACAPSEHRNFARLVRAGFAGSDATLPERIREARHLAFQHEEGALVAIAGLKAPDERTRDAVFARAGTTVPPAPYRLELGWVYVEPSRRRNGLARRLCRELLAREPGAGIFARTRSDNHVMARLLRELDFASVGVPFERPERAEELVLFARPARRGGAR